MNRRKSWTVFGLSGKVKAQVSAAPYSRNDVNRFSPVCQKCSELIVYISIYQSTTSASHFETRLNTTKTVNIRPARGFDFAAGTRTVVSPVRIQLVLDPLTPHQS